MDIIDGAHGSTNPDVGIEDIDATAEAQAVRAAATRARTLSVQISMLTAELVEAAAVFVAHEAALGGVSPSWTLSHHAGLTTTEADRIVALVPTRHTCPDIHAAMAHGKISPGVTRTLARVATTDNQAALLETAQGATARQVEVIVRDMVREARSNNPEAHTDKARKWWGRDGRFHASLDLNSHTGALLDKALDAALVHIADQRERHADSDEAAADREAGDHRDHDPNLFAQESDSADCTDGESDPDPEPEPGPGADAENVSDAGGWHGPYDDEDDSVWEHAFVVDLPDPWASNAPPPADTGVADDGPPTPPTPPTPPAPQPEPSLVDAFIHAATQVLRDCAGPTGRVPRTHQIIVHADLAAYLNAIGIGVDPPGRAWIEAGGPLHPADLPALMGSATIRWLLTSTNGDPVFLTKPAPTATPNQRHALHARDCGCAFPGCHRTTNLHAHHITERADHGPTRLTNLVMLCHPCHQRIIHDHHWSIRRDPATGHVTFSRPDGTPLETTNPTWNAPHPAPPPPPAHPQRYTGTGERLTGYARDVYLANWHNATTHWGARPAA